MIVNSYYNKHVSGMTDTGKGEPKTTEEMQNQETYSGWDFEETWGIHPELNDGYPYLSWQELEPPDPKPPEPSDSALSTVRNIANYILERGWLQKIENGVVFGWTVTGEEEILNTITSLSVSDSNTYNALLDLCVPLNLGLRFDYNAKTIEFYDKDSDDLDKNYKIVEGMNLQQYSKTLSGENFYTLYYVQGGEDEFGLPVIMFDETDYKDNFLINFDYFIETGLIDSSVLDAFDKEGELAKINKKLRDLIIKRYRQTGVINNIWSKIISTSQLMYGNIEDTKIFNQEYSKFLKCFKYKEMREDKIEKFEIFTKPFTAWWSQLKLPYQVLPIDEDVEITYNGSPWGVSYSFTPQEGYTKYLFNRGKNLSSISIYIPSGETFNIENLNVKSKVQYFVESFKDTNRVKFPIIEALYSLDGGRTIQSKINFVKRQIELTEEMWKEDYRYKKCLESLNVDGSEPHDPSDLILDTDYGTVCEGFYIPTTFGEKESLEADIQKTFDEKIYEKQIGESELSWDGTEVHLQWDEETLGQWRNIKIFLEKFTEKADSILQDLDPIIPRYRDTWKEKTDFWYELKKDRQHLFIEGYYEDSVETNPADLKTKAEIMFKNHQSPQEELSINYIDVSELLGVDLEDIRAGDFVRLKDDLHEEDTKLKVASISRSLKKPADISLTIFRYNLINELLEKLITRINQRSDN